jgi:hypothetical protein
MNDRGIDKVKVTGDGVAPEGVINAEVMKTTKLDEKVVDQVDLPGPKFDPNFFTHPEGHQRAWVIVRDTGQPHEKKQPFVSLNGYAFQFQKNVPIQLPVPVINMMKNCVFTKIERDSETGEEFVRNIPRFSIERLDHAPDGVDKNTA